MDLPDNPQPPPPDPAMEGSPGLHDMNNSTPSENRITVEKPRRRGMIVDIHTHLWESVTQLGPSVEQSLRRRINAPWERVDASVTAFDEAMAPVEYAVILGFESRHLGASIPAQQVAQYVARDPGRYLGFAGIDPLAPVHESAPGSGNGGKSKGINSQENPGGHSGGGALNALRQAQELGLVGVTVSPCAQGFHPSHSGAMKLYEQCEQDGFPILFHPGTHLGPAIQLEYAQPQLLDEVFRSFPELRAVLGQIGYPWIDQALALIGKHPHVYADLSHLTNQPWHLYNALIRAHEMEVTDKLLFGSDFPFNRPEEAIVSIYSINTLTQGTMMPTIPREQLRGIVERDTLACLGIAKPVSCTDASESTPDTHHGEYDQSTRNQLEHETVLLAI